jgi:hypothetical protein
LKSYLEIREIEPIGILYEYPSTAIPWLKGMTLDRTDVKEKFEKTMERLETIADEGTIG